jgi:signal transduction histidine kinase
LGVGNSVIGTSTPYVHSARELTRRLIEPAVGHRSDAEEIALAVHAACERTYRDLTRRLGPIGSRALLARALSHAEEAHPLLRTIRIGRRLVPSLDGAAEAIGDYGAPAVTAAFEHTLETLLALLGRLIGEDMAARLVAQPREMQAADHSPSRSDQSFELQRDIAEQLLLTALREQDAADVAEESRRAATFLASESRRLDESLDEGATLAAIAAMSLPHLGAWCIVDTLGDDQVARRLGSVHPDPVKQSLLDSLEGRWVPRSDDQFGLAAAVRGAGPMVAEDAAHSLLAAENPEVTRVLRELGMGPMLTVPIVIRDRLLGAVTFVGNRPFTADDMEIANDLANRSAIALDRARMYGEAIALTALAETANQAKSSFLGMVSHELRTPLNAIGGYVELMEMGLHGPVTGEQLEDLGRIRASQQYITHLIGDLLNFTKVGAGQTVYEVRDVLASDVISASFSLVETVVAQRRLLLECVDLKSAIVMRGDRERVIQILVNLLSNAVKFTPTGGRLVVDCFAVDSVVQMRVSDTGIGIPASKLEAIFEPFVQVDARRAGPDQGIGLGLAISRGLARGMHGDLTVESTFGEGTRFTLTLPRSRGLSEQSAG